MLATHAGALLFVVSCAFSIRFWGGWEDPFRSQPDLIGSFSAGFFDRRLDLLGPLPLYVMFLHVHASPLRPFIVSCRLFSPLCAHSLRRNASCRHSGKVF
jgi:hypothetical protein